VITCDSLSPVLSLPRGHTNVCEGIIKFTLKRPSSRKDHNTYKSTADIVLKTFHSK